MTEPGGLPGGPDRAVFEVLRVAAAMCFAATLGWVVGMGWFEIALAAAVLLVPLWPLAALACAWKIATELLFPLAGAPVWEFLERGGSYGAPLALAILAAAGRARRP